jgi:hypothetical protein
VKTEWSGLDEIVRPRMKAIRGCAGMKGSISEYWRKEREE